MNSEAHLKDQQSPSEERSKPAWLATFTLLDVSGTISSAQWERLIAPFKTLWQKRRSA